MARGAEAKQRKKEKKANAKANGEEVSGGKANFDSYFGEDPMLNPPPNVPDPVAQLEQLQAHQAKVSKPKSCCDHSDDESEEKEEEDDVMAKIKQGKKQRKKEKMAEVSKEKGGGFFGEIKLLPLLFLFLLTASTALPAFFWILDNAGGVLVKTNLTGQLGYRLGIGSTPRKRITSFYEKHSPDKLDSVDSTLSKYYGDYKTLTKKLERKYSDYGYFVGWEEDEAASKLAWEKFGEYQKEFSKAYRKKAPKQLVQASDNFYYNVGGIVKKAKVTWRKQIWPVLKPIIWVADEKEAKRQKKADAKKYGKKKKGSAAFRDEEDE
ncbi:hypothetical protein TrST_g14295 [Triparma strigata]|uniref:Uncharacterized protein n=1 Tax=Triparma strigata TaxID=1606541 RepID=A0A9W7EZC5_9STRA|nr:hypothetical protein TrST_g14295 [Triparma strigata]